MIDGINNAATKIIVCLDTTLPGGSLLRNYYTKNKQIIEAIDTAAIHDENKFFNCKTRVFEDISMENTPDVTLPLIPFEVSPADIFKDSNNSNDFHQFQEKLITFFRLNFNKIKDNIPVSIDNINILNLFKMHSFFSTKVFKDELAYTSAFIDNTIAEEAVGFMHSAIDTYIGMESNNGTRIDSLARLKEFYKIKVNEAVCSKTAKFEELKDSSMRQAKEENMEYLVADVAAHYDTRIKLIKSTNYNKLIDAFNTHAELLRLWPSWLDAPEFIDKSLLYDNHQYKILSCLSLTDCTASIETALKPAYIHKLTLLNNQKNKILDEINEILSTDNTIEELKAIKDILISIDPQHLLDKHLEQNDDSTNENTLYQILIFWPDNSILQPAPRVMEDIKSILCSNDDIIYLQ